MRSLVLLLLAACTATAADRPASSDSPTRDAVEPAAAEPAAVAPADAVPAKASAPRLAAGFDTVLLCTEIPATGGRLGDPTFGMTESDPPAPSVVGAVAYSFGNVPDLRVAGMRSDLVAIGGVDLGGARIAAGATLEDIDALAIAGCGEVQRNEGANVIECLDGDVTVTFAVGAIGRGPVQVGARSTACQ